MKCYFVVAGDIHQVTGGYRYDARMVAALRQSGRPVEVIELPGVFPGVGPELAGALDDALTKCRDGACVILDGLVSGGLPQVLQKHARRVRLVALVHHPLADEFGLDDESVARYRTTERQALAAVARVIVTSAFTAQRLEQVYAVPADAIDVVEPGVAPLPGLASRPTVHDQPPSLLCVATLVPRKGHAVLVDALSRLKDLDWSCDFVGDLQRDPACAQVVHRAIVDQGLGDRVRLRGILAPADLERAYAQARLFVLPSWYEGYGMAVPEALRWGLPIVTTTGGALARTLPPRAGLAVAPGDAPALAQALRRVLVDPALWMSLSAAAVAAGDALPGWDVAGAQFLAALDRVVPDASGTSDVPSASNPSATSDASDTRTHAGDSRQAAAGDGSEDRQPESGVAV